MPLSRVNGLDLHWTERGSGAAVLFLHGFPFDRRLWQGELDELPAGWRGIAPDLRGFGASRDSGRDPLTMAGHAADLLGLLDQLDIRQTIVCGLSMGGYVAFELLRAARERVRALILCDTRAEPDDEQARQARGETAERVRREGVEPVLAALLPKLIAERTSRQQPEVVARLRAMMEATPPETIARASLGMAERRDAGPLLATISVPTLVLGGEQDAVTAPAVLQSLAAAIPGARFALLPDAGHVSNLENPRAFGSALHGFLASVQGG